MKHVHVGLTKEGRSWLAVAENARASFVEVGRGGSRVQAVEDLKDSLLEEYGPNLKIAVWNPKKIREQLETSDAWVRKALLVIHKYQTADEKEHGATINSNGVGFTSSHAPFCTSLVDQLKDKGWLTKKQMDCARKIMVHYTRQLTKLSNKKFNQWPTAEIPPGA